jgi:hypothetical protein
MGRTRRLHGTLGIGALIAGVCLATTAAASTGTDIKTGPLRAGETLVLQMTVHPDAPIPNWAGVRMYWHVLDNTEADVLGVTRLLDPNTDFIGSPFGPKSSNSVSAVRWFTAFTPDALNSGADLPASTAVPVYQVTFQIKNSDILFNSDVDYEWGIWNIQHLGSDLIGSQFGSSASVWATSQFVPTPSEPLPGTAPPPGDPNGQWVHIPFAWGFPAGIGSSAFIARLATAGTLGIDHVPEPAAAVLLGLGTLALGAAGVTRRRRIRGS